MRRPLRWLRQASDRESEATQATSSPTQGAAGRAAPGLTFAVPILVPASMTVVFSLLRRVTSDRTAYNLGFGIYWLCWCFLVPVHQRFWSVLSGPSSTELHENTACVSAAMERGLAFGACRPSPQPVEVAPRTCGVGRGLQPPLALKRDVEAPGECRDHQR
jgi:hypothetical protein